MSTSAGHSPPPSSDPILPPSGYIPPPPSSLPVVPSSTASSSSPSDVTPSISAVTVKLPPFWPNDPEMWFAQVDAHFATRRITSQKTRFDYVIASLSPEFAFEVRDLILKPPSTDAYDTLKAQLIARTTPSQQQRLQQLFSLEELGDRKPSQLLRRLQQLLGDKAASADTSFVKELFLQRLPVNVRMVLASDTTSDLDVLATRADRMMEIVVTPPVSSLDTVTPPAEVEQLRTEIASLRQRLKHIDTRIHLNDVVHLARSHNSTVGITRVLVLKQRNVRSLVHGTRKTARPGANGD